jgi:predicted nucleic acid-binding protein
MQRADTPVEIREWIDNRPNWLEVRPSPSFDLNLKLGVGEREAITLALELKAEAILLDDRKARIEAQNKGLVVIGTLAILATAAHRGLVDLPAAIARLQQTNFRAPADLIQLILDQDHTKKGT